jgi:hypothetical protein
MALAVRNQLYSLFVMFGGSLAHSIGVTTRSFKFELQNTHDWVNENNGGTNENNGERDENERITHDLRGCKESNHGHHDAVCVEYSD